MCMLTSAGSHIIYSFNRSTKPGLSCFRHVITVFSSLESTLTVHHNPRAAVGQTRLLNQRRLS